MTEDTFIIRIWCEYNDLEEFEPEYRGLIEHVPSGVRHFLPDFLAISEVMSLYVPLDLFTVDDSGANPFDKLNCASDWWRQQKRAS
ncbi:MAG: hypothetical protein KBE23_14440 [Chloroflexi bacterium]|nr:hypothetical protein [Chloroflexota bacterium]MBP7043941.1 hypothetical protein [Chloroflexota bacterium]